ncbi:hypothetical protein Ae201684P_001245 [Aphanomyces euteiches]|nr:hypothetical protein Ae201684P_001245 [Aphanomyces euteiches]KAH9149051.1 hypothetical protein AeRB84_007747 [Aphanomyces euteiches]KAH9149070.1 hypothetical protein AeRB84_007766 [Aphanomyces euteiches]KAH9152053.1 hypothetical protein AeRB84_005476 [Aphanomyces euteiches]
MKKWKLLGFVLIIVGVVLCLRFLKVGKALESVSVWIEHHKALGVLTILACFVVATVFGLPSTIFEALAGFFFGWLGSCIISSFGKCMGSVVAFLIGRHFLADMVEVWMQKYPVVQALALVFASKSSWQLLFCVQLSYIPLTLKCYMLSMLPVTLFRFLVTNFLCGIPYSVFWGYVGSESKDVAKLFSGEGETSKVKVAIMASSIGFGLLGLAAVGYYTKKKLTEIQRTSATDATAQIVEGTRVKNPKAAGVK